MPTRPNDVTNAMPRPVANEMERRRRLGEEPTIAPKVVLETPMWIDPRAASRRERLTREFCDIFRGAVMRSSLDVQNPLPAEGNGGSRSPHGVLRYIDLDLVMAISKAWTEGGGGDGAVELEQIKIFEWMGYRNLLQAPYAELRAALKRLQWTNIAVGEQGGRPTPFRLVHSVFEQAEAGPGKPKVFTAHLDPIWRQALLSVTDWQAVDLQAYAKLAREHRGLGLARVVYLYLVSHRNASDEFTIPLYGLHHRYGQRNNDGTLRHADPMRENELLMRALKTLHETGVCKLEPVEPAKLAGAILRGRFVRPREPLMIATQQRFISPGIWDDKPVLTLPAPAAEPPQEPTPTPSPPPAAPPERDHVADSCVMLNRELLVGKSAIQKAHRTGGWSPRQILHLMAWVYWQYKTEGSVENPGGLFVAKLREHPPSHFDKPHGEAWEWLRQAWPQLPVFKAKPTAPRSEP